jgi:outer membrane protein TolC
MFSPRRTPIPSSWRLASTVVPLALLLAIGPAHAQLAPAPALPATVKLSPKLLLQLVVARSPEVRYSRAQIEVAGQLSEAEAGLYESVLFGSFRRDGSLRQRTVEERIGNLQTASQAVLDEQNKSAEGGVKMRVPTGGEVSLSYRLRERRNNIIGSGGATAGGSDREYDGAMVISLRQPLLKGFGRDVAETDLRLANIEHRIALFQYQQQLLKTGNDALSLFWQLYRTSEVRAIRRQALDYARRVEADTAARVDAGKLARSNVTEAKAGVLLREVELMRAGQAVQESQSRLETMLAVSGLAQTNLELVTDINPAELAIAQGGSAEQRYRRALDTWPALGIARLRAEQAGIRLDYADNLRLPSLDLVLSQSGTGLSNDNKVARELTEQVKYPGWSIGLSFEIPIEGNRKARAQYNAQAARVHQAELEIASIRNALGNEVLLRWEQAAGGRDEVGLIQADVALRTEMLRIEQVRYESGISQLSQLLLRENELTEARQRLAESHARQGQANDALRFADGSLLQHYAITLEK